MGYEEYFPWNTDEEVAQHFFSTASVSYQDLIDHPEGLFFGEKQYKLYEDIGFSTDSKKVELYSPRMEELGASGIPEHVEPQQSPVSNPELVKLYPEILLTGARKIENQGAQLHDIPSLRARVPEAYAEVSTVTAAKYGILNGEMIGLESTRGMIKVRAKVTDDIMQGVISIPYGWPGSNSNELLDATLRDPVSGYITLRGLACRIVKLS
jgi:anaerobic selenocysteine-containing dehydrogenase